MRDNFLNHNFDKIILLILIVLGGVLLLHAIHHGADGKDYAAFVEHEEDILLGAIILILTGRSNRADGQTGNGLPPGVSPPYPARPPELDPVTRSTPVTGIPAK